jgi:hypothetical protein
VLFYGVGGLSFDHPRLSQESRLVCLGRPDAIILQFGGNCLDKHDIDPIFVAREVIKFATNLRRISGAQLVIVCCSLKRSNCRHCSAEVFNLRLSEYNSELKRLISFFPHLRYQNHRGLWQAWSTLLIDGVHLTHAAMHAYYRSIRGAAIQASRVCEVGLL